MLRKYPFGLSCYGETKNINQYGPGLKGGTVLHLAAKKGQIALERILLAKSS